MTPVGGFKRCCVKKTLVCNTALCACEIHVGSLSQKDVGMIDQIANKIFKNIYVSMQVKVVCSIRYNEEAYEFYGNVVIKYFTTEGTTTSWRRSMDGLFMYPQKPARYSAWKRSTGEL